MPFLDSGERQELSDHACNAAHLRAQHYKVRIRTGKFQLQCSERCAQFVSHIIAELPLSPEDSIDAFHQLVQRIAKHTDFRNLAANSQWFERLGIAPFELPDQSRQRQ